MGTIIKSSSELRKNYNSIADICRKTKVPVFLTRNGVGDTVIMDIETFNQREDDLVTAERLLAAERSHLLGTQGYTIDEFEKNMPFKVIDATMETGKAVAMSESVKLLLSEEGMPVYELVSGEYRFEINIERNIYVEYEPDEMNLGFNDEDFIWKGYNNSEVMAHIEVE